MASPRFHGQGASLDANQKLCPVKAMQAFFSPKHIWIDHRWITAACIFLSCYYFIVAAFWHQCNLFLEFSIYTYNFYWHIYWFGEGFFVCALLGDVKTLASCKIRLKANWLHQTKMKVHRPFCRPAILTVAAASPWSLYYCFHWRKLCCSQA